MKGSRAKKNKTPKLKAPLLVFGSILLCIHSYKNHLWELHTLHPAKALLLLKTEKLSVKCLTCRHVCGYGCMHGTLDNQSSL